MKLVRYVSAGGAPRCGAVDGSQIRDLGGALLAAQAAPDDMNALLERGLDAIRQWAAEAPVGAALAGTRLLSPVGRPGKILALAGNYYVIGAPRKFDGTLATPYSFIKPATTVSGHEDTITMWPFAAEVIEEIELAAVIGKRGRDIPVEKALEYVAGYTILNDISGRSLAQPAERRAKDRDGWFDWLNGKWFDGFCGIGPWIVTADEIPDPQDLLVTTRVSGQERFAASTQHMIHTTAEWIAYISKITTLEPGDVLATGVYHPGGEETMLRDGDVVEGEIEKIGVLRQRFVRGG